MQKCSKQVRQTVKQASFWAILLRSYVFTYKAVSSESLFNEVSSAAEKSRNVCHGVVVYMESEIWDAMQGIFCRVDGNVAFCCVQHMRHSYFLEIFNVLDGFAVTKNDAGIDLKTQKSKVMISWNLRFSFSCRKMKNNWLFREIFQISGPRWKSQVVATMFFKDWLQPQLQLFFSFTV